MLLVNSIGETFSFINFEQTYLGRFVYKKSSARVATFLFSTPYYLDFCQNLISKMAQKRVNNAALAALAERMFVEDGMNAKAIANAVGVSEQTIGRWRKGIGKNSEDWDSKRKKFLATPHNIKKLLANELSNLVEGKEQNLDLKAINDAIKALQSMSDETSVEVVYTVFKEFDNWMAKQDPDTAVLFLEWHKEFLLHKAQMES